MLSGGDKKKGAFALGYTHSDVSPMASVLRADGRRASLSGITSSLLCPITQELMTDPQMTEDGHTYERQSIDKWLGGHQTSPITGGMICSNDLVPNLAMKFLVDDLIRRRPEMKKFVFVEEQDIKTKANLSVVMGESSYTRAKLEQAKVADQAISGELAPAEAADALMPRAASEAAPAAAPDPHAACIEGECEICLEDFDGESEVRAGRAALSVSAPRSLCPRRLRHSLARACNSHLAYPPPFLSISLSLSLSTPPPSDC
jgi:hypothetical protein